MGKGRHGANNGAFLSTALIASGDKNSCIFAPETSSSPLASSRVPECFPLGWKIPITSGDAEEKSIVRLKYGWGSNWDIGLWGSMHHCQNLLRNRFRNSKRNGALELIFSAFLADAT